MKSRYLDENECKRLHEVLRPDEWLPLWVSLETGLRVGDVVALKRSNVRVDGIHYRAQKTRKNGIAPISAELRRELLARRGKWLFPSKKDKTKHITRQAVWARVKRGARNANIDLEGASPHAMRKSFAVELYRDKGFKAVQEALQHHNGATTEIYSFADWSTGENADKPLTRRDMQLLVKMVIEALGGATFGEGAKESRGKKKSSTKSSRV